MTEFLEIPEMGEYIAVTDRRRNRTVTGYAVEPNGTAVKGKYGGRIFICVDESDTKPYKPSVGVDVGLAVT